MSKREDEAFKAWADELSKQVEDGDKAAFEEWVKTGSAKEAYRGYLREAEFHRRLNELQTEKQELEAEKEELTEWFEKEKPKNEALLKERDQLRAQLAEVGLADNPPAASSTPKGVELSAEKLAELEKKASKVEVLDRLIPAALGEMALVLKDAIKNNFDVDPREVINLSLQRNTTPYQAYELLTADERQKRYEAEREAERKKWYEEGRKAAQATVSPDHLQPSGPSVVDYLRQTLDGKRPESDRNARVADAMKELEAGNF